MLNKNNKGISEIVVTIIIILLAIVVFAVVSLVVRGTVTKGTENIELSANCLEVEMHATKIAKAFDGSQQFVGYDVTFSRSGTGEKLYGTRVVIEDTEGYALSSADIVGDIRPLDKKIERVLNKLDTPTTFIPAKVTLIPFFQKKSGDLSYCENTFTDELKVTA